MVVVLKANASGASGSAGLPDVASTFGSTTTVPPNAWTTVVSRTVPISFVMRLSGVIATGSADGEWAIFDNATEVYRTRTSGTDRSLEILHGHSLAFLAGHVVSLKVVHQEATPQNFYGTLLSYDA